jgi:UDP-N-acetylglucosamine kinase
MAGLSNRNFLLIEVRVLALNHRRSWLGVLRRYEDEKSRRGTGRMAPREVHDEVYDGLVKSLDQLVPRAHVRLRIFNRDHEVFDSNQRLERSAAPQILTAERDRDWTTDENDAYRDGVEQLVTRTRNRGADADTVDAYQRLADGI